MPGQGAFGWNLTGGNTTAKFPNDQAMIDFVSAGSVNGAGYAPQSQGTGRMPGFGAVLTDQQLQAIIEYVRSLCDAGHTSSPSRGSPSSAASSSSSSRSAC